MNDDCPQTNPHPHFPRSRSLRSNYNAHNGGVAAALALLDAEHTVPDNEDDEIDIIVDNPRSSDANKLVHRLLKESKEDPNAHILAGESGVEVKAKEEEVHLPSRKHIAKWTSRIFASAKDLEAAELEKRHKLELQGEGHGLLGEEMQRGAKRRALGTFY